MKFVQGAGHERSGGWPLSRRTWLNGITTTAVGAGAAACRQAAVAPIRYGRQSAVSIVRCGSYEGELQSIVRALLSEHRVPLQGRRVLLKPNLVEFAQGRAVNTDARLVFAVYEAVCAMGASAVRIAEGPGHRRVTFEMAEDAGYFKAIPHFEAFFTDLNTASLTEVALRSPRSALRALHLPAEVLDCDLLISMPKLKTHHWTGATLAMKNLFGVVPGAVYGWPKNILHWAGIHECVADLHTLFPRQFCLVDGIEAMEGNGPILGTTRHAGVIVAGPDPVTVDATCCHLMGIDPGKIDYLRYSRKASLAAQDLPQMGEPLTSAMSPFALPPGLEHLRAV